jgi:hypothetical protein
MWFLTEGPCPFAPLWAVGDETCGTKTHEDGQNRCYCSKLHLQSVAGKCVQLVTQTSHYIYATQKRLNIKLLINIKSIGAKMAYNHILT